jgi:hypothetical protein
MNRQEVMNTLAELEEYFFYKKNNPGDLSEMQASLEEIHHNIKAELERWHRMTGCKIQ